MEMENPVATRRPLTLALVLVGTLIGAALLVVLTADRPADIDPSSPEGAVQAYATAVISGDERTAASYLSSGALARCVNGSSVFIDGDMQVNLISTDVRPGSADVRVSIVRIFDGGLFGATESRTEANFDLADVDGHWKIDGVPWELRVCPPTLEPDGVGE